jgi:hypothetical protein
MFHVKQTAEPHFMFQEKRWTAPIPTFDFQPPAPYIRRHVHVSA